MTKKFLPILVLSFAVVSYFAFTQKERVTTKPESPQIASAPQTTNQTKRTKSAAAPGRQEYSISTSHNSPQFYKAIIDPEDVRLGQRQTMTVSLKDDKAPITEVVANIQTDKETVKQPLKLISGTASDGIWEGSWIVHDTHDISYTTIFAAKNSIGETGEARLSWTDPGCSCTGTNCTISANCTVSGVDGADFGNLVINGGTTTVPNATYLVYGTLTVSGGALSVNTGGIVTRGYICMDDTDRDNYPQTTSQVYDSQFDCADHSADYWRRYAMSSIVTTDCLDSNNQVYPGRSEVCGNGIDDNCVNGIDEGCTCWGISGACDAGCAYNSTQFYCNTVVAGGACSANGSGSCYKSGSQVIYCYVDSMSSCFACSEMGYGYTNGNAPITCTWYP